MLYFYIYGKSDTGELQILWRKYAAFGYYFMWHGYDMPMPQAVPWIKPQQPWLQSFISEKELWSNENETQVAALSTKVWLSETQALY